jgi:hypothetical protein
MNSYLHQVKTQSNNQVADHHALKKSREVAEWKERLTPLETRLAKLLATIPTEVKGQGLALETLRSMLLGKWRGNCHPGELGKALRKLGFERRRSWLCDASGFRAKWYPIVTR